MESVESSESPAATSFVVFEGDDSVVSCALCTRLQYLTR